MSAKRLLLLSVLALSLPLTSFGAADVSGPSSSTDHAIATFNGTTGKIIQDSPTVGVSQYGDIYWTTSFGMLYLHSMSSATRDSRPPANGMLFYNSTLGLPQYYGNGSWHSWIDDGNVPANMFYAGPYQASGTNGSAQATFRYIQPNDIGGTDVMYVPQGTGFPRIISHGEQATASLILENDISLADNTTNNASTNLHGFLRKLDNDSTHYLDGKGNLTVPPGGAGDMLQAGSNNVTGTLRVTGSYQYGWTDLGSSTNLTGATNALFKILTGNLILTNSIRDNENVRLQVTQDATGSRTLQIDNVSAWIDNTNQSSTMPGINTNGGRFSIVDVWRVNGTNYGTVNTSPSVYSAALNGLSPSATGGKILGLNTNSATPSFLDVAPGSYISNSVIYAGTSFSVGTTNVTSPVLSGTTPSAPSNGKLIGWQTSGGNISGAIVGDGNAAHYLDGTGAYTTPAGSGGGGLTNSVNSTNLTTLNLKDNWANHFIQTSGSNITVVPTVPADLTDAATVATDASTGVKFRVTLGGNRTLGNPTNPTDRQEVLWEILQDGTGNRTITMDTKFAFGSDITGITLTTNASKRDFVKAVYDLTADKWYVIGFTRGY